MSTLFHRSPRVLRKLLRLIPFCYWFENDKLT